MLQFAIVIQTPCNSAVHVDFKSAITLIHPSEVFSAGLRIE